MSEAAHLNHAVTSKRSMPNCGGSGTTFHIESDAEIVPFRAPTYSIEMPAGWLSMRSPALIPGISHGRSNSLENASAYERFCLWWWAQHPDQQRCA